MTTPVALSTGRSEVDRCGQGRQGRVDDLRRGRCRPARTCSWAPLHGRPHDVAAEPRDRLRHSGFREDRVGARHEATRVRRAAAAAYGLLSVAEADGNRTRPAEMLGCTGFEDREGHQAPVRLRGEASVGSVTDPSATVRLTQYAAGGGCACKIPPGELEEVVRGPAAATGSGRRPAGRVSTTGTTAPWCGSPTASAVISTADFFTPVVDDAYDFGRIVAANALSDVYAMGGRPVLAINLVGWPRSVLPLELLREVLRGGLDVAGPAGCPVAGGH